MYLPTPWIELLATVMTTALGLVMLAVPPRSVARVSYGVGMLLLGLESILLLISTQVGAPGATVFREGAMITTAMASPVWLLFSVHYGRGHRPPLARAWKAVLLVAFVAPLSIILLPGDLLARGSMAAVFADIPVPVTTKAQYLHCLALFTTGGALANLEQTFRAVTGTMRWRIKFLLVGVGIVLLQSMFINGWAVIQREWLPSHVLVHSIAVTVACLFMFWSLARMGLSEVAVYPSKKVMLSVATTSLILVYALFIAAIAWLVSQSVQNGTPAFVALTILGGLLLLGVLLLSDRVRQVTILFFNRQFSRPQFDYRALWQTFTEQVAPAVEESEYCRLSTRFVSRTLNALSVTLWLLSVHRKLSFGGSTLLTADSAQQAMSTDILSRDLIEALEHQEGVLDLDEPGTSWADARSRLYASEFREAGGHRLCVPLRAGGEFLGFLLVGDRVSARAYSAEELDLLHTLANEISRGLLNLRNSKHLAAQRELQAFQTMSAFVIHDLKNTASALSLTLQNFERHADNPAFREDALRAVSGSASHIDDVVRALGALRKELEIKPLESDLNALVREALADLGGPQFLPVCCKLRETPRLRVDQVQIKKVVTNLLMNARDAIEAGGTVEVTTGLRNSNLVELTVRDNGCGMDREYVRTKLFKPFHSTKKEGLGIGLFQVQAILEAHHGEIEVESACGVGTVFRVLLPIDANAK